MNTSVTNLLDRERLSLHNGTTSAGDDAGFRTAVAMWAYAVSLPVVIPPASEPGRRAVIEVGIRVFDGGVGVGLLDESLQQFVTSEVDVVAGGGFVRIQLQADACDARRHVMLRNTSPNGASRFQIVEVTLHFAAANVTLLRALTPPQIGAAVLASANVSATFDVLISHSSRRWYAEQCDREYLRRRYAGVERFEDLPPFESLPANTAPYHGLLSLFRIELSAGGIRGRLLRHYISTDKVVHAAAVGDDVVVGFDAGVAVLPRAASTAGLELDSAGVERVDDPWLGGVHTVIASGPNQCLISSSGADAILWLDVARRKIVRRWRLPASRYGFNYALDDSTRLSEHYIGNDLQLGHLNCAAPDGAGGAFVSVLGQGDIGHVDASGGYRLITSGYVGCHGVRYAATGDLLYFCDSCAGRLLAVDRAGVVTTLVDARSRWLHDGVRLTDELFLVTVGDRNALVLADAQRGRLAEWDFNAVQGTVQFLSLLGGGEG